MTNKHAIPHCSIVTTTRRNPPGGAGDAIRGDKIAVKTLKIKEGELQVGVHIGGKRGHLSSHKLGTKNKARSVQVNAPYLRTPEVVAGFDL